MYKTDFGEQGIRNVFLWTPVDDNNGALSTWLARGGFICQYEAD